MLKPLCKLKFLSIFEETRPRGGLFGTPQPVPDGVHGSIIAQVPQLQALILYRQEVPNNMAGNFGFAFGQQLGHPMRQICEHYGNTLVVTTNYLRARDLATVKKIGPLLKKTNYAQYFDSQMSPNDVPQPEFDFELLAYLFKELKLDINCNTNDTSNPFVADVFTLTFSREVSHILI